MVSTRYVTTLRTVCAFAVLLLVYVAVNCPYLLSPSYRLRSFAYDHVCRSSYALGVRSGNRSEASKGVNDIQDGDLNIVLRSDSLRALQQRAKRLDSLRTNRTCDNDNVPGGFLVPNVVHYIWFVANRNFTFTHYLSFRSVHRYLSPDCIFVHGDSLPLDGHWWRRTLDEVANLYFVPVERPLFAPSGKKLQWVQHSSDVTRISIAITYGGIYLDTDVYAMKSFDDLRRYPMVMGRETSTQINSGIILGRRGETFLRLWLESYLTYRGETEIWSNLATDVPHQVASICPHLIHVEETSLNRPNWREKEVLYLGHYDWSQNYAVHVWQRNVPAKVPQRPSDVDRLDTTVGEISRWVLYGSKEMRAELESVTKR